MTTSFFVVNVDSLFPSCSSSSMLSVVLSAVTLFFFFGVGETCFYATGHPGLLILVLFFCFEFNVLLWRAFALVRMAPVLFRRAFYPCAIEF